MNTSQSLVRVRRMNFLDIGTVFSIDQIIRAGETSVTYKDFTSEKLFGIHLEEVGPGEKPDVLELAKLIDLGFIAEAEGKMCGFVVGRQAYLAERGIQEGEIVIIGVSPDSRGKGIGAKLVNTICDLFHSRGVSRVRIGVDPLDNDMLAFLGRVGFSGHHLLQYTKTC